MNRIISAILIFAFSLTPKPIVAQVSGPFYGPVVGAQPAASGPATHVQSCTGTETGASASSATVTCGSTVGAGHLLFLTFASYTNTPTSITLSGESGTLHSILTNYLYLVGSSIYLSTYYVLSTSGGETTITLNAGSGSFGFSAVVMDEFSASGAFVFDTADSGNSGLGTTATSNSITPATNGELIIGAVAQNSNSVTTTANSPFTLGANTGPSSTALEYYLQQPTAASIAATFTYGSLASWGANVSAFKY